MFDLFIHFYNTVLYEPVFNLVILLYSFSPGPNLGWAIVMLAVIVRLLFLPLTLKGYRTDQLLEEVSHEVTKIENDPNLDAREKRSRTTQIMKAHGINPTSEIYSLIGQLLFLAVLYQIVQYGIHPEGFDQLYSFVPHPTFIDTIFFGIDVSQPNVYFGILAAGMLFVEQLWEFEDKKHIPHATFSAQWYPLLLPLITFILLMLLPATKAIFLATSIFFSLGIRFMMVLGRSAQR